MICTVHCSPGYDFVNVPDPISSLVLAENGLMLMHRVEVGSPLYLIAQVSNQ